MERRKHGRMMTKLHAVLRRQPREVKSPKQIGDAGGGGGGGGADGEDAGGGRGQHLGGQHPGGRGGEPGGKGCEGGDGGLGASQTHVPRMPQSTVAHRPMPSVPRAAHCGLVTESHHVIRGPPGSLGAQLR